MLLLIVPLVRAAEFWNTNRNTSSYQVAPQAEPSTFEAFVRDLPERQSPFETWLIPPWIQYLRTCNGQPVKSYKELIGLDEEFMSYMEFLENPKIFIHDSNQEAGKDIEKDLREQGRKLSQAIDFAIQHNHNEWLIGLKGLAMRLMKNAHKLPALADQIRATNGGICNTGPVKWMASVAGILNKSAAFFTLTTNYVPKWDGYFYGNQVIPDAFPSQDLSRMLKRGLEVLPDARIEDAEEALLQMRQTMTMTSAELGELVKMVPVGRRFTLALDTKSKVPCILDMIKHLDGQVYGVRYTLKSLFMAPAVAFCTPFEELPPMTKFYMNATLFTDYHFKNVKPIHFPWYPADKVNDNISVYRYYLAAWPLGDRQPVGIIWHICILLSKNPKSKIINECADKLNHWLEIIKMITIDSAKILLEKVKALPKPTDAEADNLLGILTRAIIAATVD